MRSSFLWLLIGFLLALGLLWLVRRIRQQGQQRRAGDDPQFEELLRRYSRQLAGMFEDRQTMVYLLADELPQALAIAQSAVLFVEGQELVAANGLRLPINHTVVRRVAAAGEATPVDSELARLLDQGRAALGWTAVWVPLMRGSNLYGLWLLGQRQHGWVYTPSHLQWLTTLARQAAMLLETVAYAAREQTTARQMQALYHQAVSASEGERQRLARELHDGVIQDLCALARDLKALSHKSAIPTCDLAPLETYANEAVSALRTICHDLRPPFLTDNLPLAIRVLVDRLDAHALARVSFKTNVERLELAEKTTLAFYRVAQEAINNACHHAQASEILVRLTQYPDRLRLTIHDDGCGIPASDDLGRFVALGHYGVAGMQERAKMIEATLEIHSAQNYGTAVILQLSADNYTVR